MRVVFPVILAFGVRNVHNFRGESVVQRGASRPALVWARSCSMESRQAFSMARSHDPPGAANFAF